MAGTLKKARKKIEIALIRLGLAILPFWPRRLIIGLARLAGTIGYYCASGQRRLAMTNLEIAFGKTKSAAEQKRIAREAFRFMTLVFLDYFWFARRSAERVKKHVLFDPSFAAHFPPPPTVVVTAHFGGWELLSRTMAVNGYSHVAIAAPLSNPDATEIIEHYRAAYNVDMIPIRGAVRGLLRALRGGKYIALVLDQNTKPEDGGIFVNLFGLPVPMSTSAALLAERVNAPITPLFCRSQWNGQYIVYCLPPVRTVNSPAGPDSVRDLTRKIASVFQGEIEARPEQWLWMYKRWKHIKPGTPPGGYPYYSKPLQ